MIYKSMQSTEIKDIDEGKRRIRFIATTHEVDREGDIVHIMPSKKGGGLLIPRGDKTPLKTFHDYRSYPVGFARDWELSHRKATFTGEFFGPEVSEEADLAFRVAKTGVLCTSIGFLDHVSDMRQLSEDEQKMVAGGRRIKTGMEYFESELIEDSLTDVPTNPGAVPAKDTEEMVRKYLAEIVQAGGGCARKGCQTTKDKSFDEFLSDSEMLVIKAIQLLSSSEAKEHNYQIDKDAVQSLLGHLRDLEYLLWAKDDLHQDALDEIQSWIHSKAKGGK